MVAAANDVTQLLSPPLNPSNKAKLDEAEARREEARIELDTHMSASKCEDIEPLRIAIESSRVMGLDAEEVQPAVDHLRRLETKHGPLTFTDVPRRVMDQLKAASSREQAVTILSSSLGVDKKNGGFHQEVLVEYHYHNFAFCQRSNFSGEKTSTFLSIMKTLHTRAVASPAEKMTEREARFLFEELLERHSQQMPPYKFGVFSQGEVDLLRAFAERSFFRHFKMYASIYVTRHDIEITSKDFRALPQAPNCAAFTLDDEIDPRKEFSRLDGDLQRLNADRKRCQEEGNAELLEELTQHARAVELQKMWLQVGDLASLVIDPAAEAATSADLIAAKSAAQTTPQASGESSPPKSNKDDIAAAIDEAMQAHLGGLDGKLQLPDI